jgi:hypothetical protein
MGVFTTDAPESANMADEQVVELIIHAMVNALNPASIVVSG